MCLNISLCLIGNESDVHVCVSACGRPIDLLTVKKNIELGVTRTTAEFQRDVMLMFVNSIMYNKSSHFVHKMAQQMQQEGLQHVQVSQHYSHNVLSWLVVT